MGKSEPVNRLLKAIKREKTDRKAFLLLCGQHLARLTNSEIKTAFNDCEVLNSGLTKAIEQYLPDGITVGYDPLLEAEILGCKIRWDEKAAAPEISYHPLAEDFSKLRELKNPQAPVGRLPLYLNSVKYLKQKHPETAAVGVVTSPLTLAMHLMGNSVFFTRLYDSTEKLNELFTFCSEVSISTAKHYLNAGVDVIAISDTVICQPAEQQFNNSFLPILKKFFCKLNKLEIPNILLTSGHGSHLLEAIAQCGCQAIGLDNSVNRDSATETGKKFNTGICHYIPEELLLHSSAETTCLVLKDWLEKLPDKSFISTNGEVPMEVRPTNISCLAKILEAGKNGITDTHLERILNNADTNLKLCIVVDDEDYKNPTGQQQELIDYSKKIIGIEIFFQSLNEWSGSPFLSSHFKDQLPIVSLSGKTLFSKILPSHQQLYNAIIDYQNENIKK